MRLKQTLKSIFVGALLTFGLTATVLSPTVFAAGNNGCETDTAIIKCDNTDQPGVENTGIWQLLIQAINILSAGVAVLAVAGIVYASILYTSAGGSQEQVKKAMGMITNIVIGIIAYALMFSALNFLIPGGLFN